MEYINIISKEPIMAVPDWMAYTILGIFLTILLAPIIYIIVTKKPLEFYRFVMMFGIGAIIFEVIALLICTTFFKEPTGRYKYEATIDKDKITVIQYEEFIQKYNPTVENGVYYWEDEKIKR